MKQVKAKKKNSTLWKILPFGLAVIAYLFVPKDVVEDTIGSDVTSQETAQEVRVHMLDVGQGLSVLIQAGEDTLLYDGGCPETSSQMLTYLQRQGVKDLDYVVVSHYDADHLGGINAALNAYEPGMILAPEYEADTYTYDSFVETLKQRGLTVSHPEEVLTLSLGGAQLQVLPPTSEQYEDENDFSLVVRVSIGENSLLLMGDATAFREGEILAENKGLNSDVLIIGHHGSYSSTAEEFLTAISPEYALISCGIHNDYGHPHKRVMELLEEKELPIYRTDLQGTICFTMTEEGIVFDEVVCEDYSHGDELRSLYQSAGKGESQSGKDTPYYGELREDLSIFPYVINTYRMRYHLPDCESVAETSARNRQGSNLSEEALREAGYTPCGSCKP